MDLSVKVRALRVALGLTQEALGELGDMSRTDVVLVETGKNKASSFEKRKKLARALGLSIESFDAYVSGEITVDAALSRSARKAPEAEAPTTEKAS